ncbi:MAG: alcohol dehydrogenase catalytic domain-containing protein [Bifidobacteriaceae bacterium]|jgi:S-(hydroxymethyl)glutathione dehydrogenase/alcohol dehydrogenase|nr:alcohol dehydrogenase catalytic domain-containing protein [Bifidobacteriaceae bacterium]
MRAQVFRQVGQPLEMTTLRDPRPEPGEVLVKVAACGVCHSDLHVMRGDIAFPTPAVLGHEMSGTVVEVGPGVTNVAVGDPVATTFIMPCGACPACWRGQEELCQKFFGLNRLKGHLYDDRTRLFDGRGEPVAMYSMAALGELSVVPATAAFKLPPGLALAESAVLGCAFFTAFGAVRTTAKLSIGETMAVIGAGGVGLAAIQVARAVGASRIVAVDVDDGKLAAARAAGATDAVNSLAADAAAVVRELTGGGVDAAVEAVGRGETIVQAVAMVREGGRVAPVGLAGPGATADIPITHLVRRKVQVLGSFGARPRVDMPAVLGLAASGAIDYRSAVTRRYRHQDAWQAYADLGRGEVIGRAIIDYAGSGG